MFYMAPEVFDGGHELPCDMWSIGVIAYELLSGQKPFTGHTEETLKQNIRSMNYSFDDPLWDDISNNAIDFIEATLVTNPEKRLNTMQALNHPWLLNVGINCVQSDDEEDAGEEEIILAAFLRFHKAT